MKMGLRAFKTHTSETIQKVIEERSSIEITVEGEPVAVLEPAVTPFDRDRQEALWAERRRLAEQITSNWNGTLTVAEAVQQQRSDP